MYNYATGEQKIQYKVANECYSAALLCGGKMILTGDKEHITFYELETGKRIGMYRDIHSDVINHLVPHPLYPTVFASGSEDGLVGKERELNRRFVCSISLEAIKKTRSSAFSRPTAALPIWGGLERSWTSSGVPP